MHEFWIVPSDAVSKVLQASVAQVKTTIAETYRWHEEGASVNPDSYFLRFPGKPTARVIALPAYLGGDVDRMGIKWISSFPSNSERGLPRASAVLILNDYSTGYPVACLEAAAISAARTAASAAVTASALLRGRSPESISFIGTGVIAGAIATYLGTTAHFPKAFCYDLDPARARSFASTASVALGTAVNVVDDLESALHGQVVVFATTASRPYVPLSTRFARDQVVLHVSLRDLPPELLLEANNIVDDVEHCLKASTSPHLAEQLTGSRSFINGTIGQLLRGDDVQLDPDRPTVVSPFGLGILDIALGDYVLRRAIDHGDAVAIPGFFGSGGGDTA